MAKGSICKVILIGRLGQDPEIKTTQNGSHVANLSIATTDINGSININSSLDLGGTDTSGTYNVPMSWKSRAIIATTGDITLASPATTIIDDQSVSTGDRVLVKNQSDPTENGHA